YEIGRASAVLGAGRLSKDDKIDLNAGIIMKKRLGDRVQAGEVIAEVFAKTKEKCTEGADIIKRAIDIRKTDPEKKPLIFKEID
ncbi:MAG: pyrimidine-nucleoside phosphorylase, partial [Eubacterium sp.]|nr:pyrimidine-nucleoside phosphorylase [Eubacterium sp.]